MVMPGLRRTFLERLRFHYEVYRGYPLPRWSALKNAWRIARA
jgi:hypothetical protein